MTVALAAVVIGYLAICALLFTQQRKILFPAPESKAPPVVHVPAAGPVIVYFHGNGASAGEAQWLADLFPAHGFVAIEYPGYGHVPGEPTEGSIYEAAEQQLVALGLARDRVVLLGQSLGTGPAVELAKRGWGVKMVLMTPFTSVPDAAQLAFPWLPARWLVRDRFDNAAKAPGITMPVLVVHGDRDEVVPYELGKRLTPLFPHGELMTVPGGHHNDLWDRPEVVARVRAFL